MDPLFLKTSESIPHFVTGIFNTSRWPGPLPRVGNRVQPLRIGILISGRGSNMSSIIRRQQQPDCCHRTTVVISDRKDAAGLIIAKEHGIPSQGIQIPSHADEIAEQIANEITSDSELSTPLAPTSLAQRVAHEMAVDSCLDSHDVELVVLAGYMRIFTPWFIRRHLGHLINIHPSLLPDFPGAHAARDALEAETSRSGCTVHHVDVGVDTGSIIAQASVPVENGDTVTTLVSRIQTQEHILYPAVLDSIATRTPLTSLDELIDLRLPL